MLVSSLFGGGLGGRITDGDLLTVLLPGHGPAAPDPLSAPSSGTCTPRTARPDGHHLSDRPPPGRGLPDREPGHQPREAGRADLEAYLGDLLSRRAPATAATYYKVLKLLYQWLEDEEEIPANPMAKMRPPIVPDQPVPDYPDDALAGSLPPAPAKASRPAGTPP